MPNVLTIDFSARGSCELCLSSVEGQQWRQLEFVQTALDSDVFKELGQLGESEHADQSPEDVSKFDLARNKLQDCFEQLFNKLSQSWTSSAIILPPSNVISLNLELPVSNKRSILKVLKLELEDRLPFSLDEFHIQFSVHEKLKNGLYDIHCDLIPRKEIEAVLEISKKFGLDPAIVTTPPCVLGVLATLTPTSPQSCAWVLAQQDQTHICLQLNGAARMTRSISHGEGGSSRKILTQYQALLRSFKERYGESIEQGFLLPNSVESPFDKIATFERLSAASLPKQGNIGALCSILFQSSASPEVITNFRSADLAYRPQVDEVVRGLKQLRKPFALAASVALVCLMLIYWMQGHRRNRLENSLSAQVQQVLPNLPSRGKELQELQAELGALHQQLRDIGSASKVSPVNALLELMADFNPVPDGVELKKLSVTGSRISLEGHAPDYSTIDMVTEKLRARSSLYCEVPEPKANAIRRNRYSFEINVGMCEG